MWHCIPLPLYCPPTQLGCDEHDEWNGPDQQVSASLGYLSKVIFAVWFGLKSLRVLCAKMEMIHVQRTTYFRYACSGVFTCTVYTWVVFLSLFSQPLHSFHYYFYATILFCTLRFVLMVKRGYRDPPYHNWMHAFSVAHFLYALYCCSNKLSCLDDLEVLALFVSCLCHDIDHRGTNNAFQVCSVSPN